MLTLTLGVNRLYVSSNFSVKEIAPRLQWFQIKYSRGDKGHTACELSHDSRIDIVSSTPAAQ